MPASGVGIPFKSEVLKLIADASIFGMRPLKPAADKILRATAVIQIPISVELNVVQPFNGAEIFVDVIIIQSAFQTPRFLKKLMLGTYRPGKTGVVFIIER